MKDYELAKISLNELLQPAIDRRLQELTPEQILKSLTPEQILKSLTSEQILTMLTPEQLVKMFTTEEIVRIFEGLPPKLKEQVKQLLR